MPRIILTKRPRPSGHDKLVKRLAQELKSPGNGVDPLIIERVIAVTSSRHVHVIWDAWNDLTDEQRSDVICEAYAAAEGNQAVEDITLAAGVTPQESVVLGLLPYKVEALRKRHESKPPMARYQKAFKAEARNTILGPEADVLRYPRLEDAQEAKNRLEKALRGSEWAVVEEVAYDY